MKWVVSPAIQGVPVKRFNVYAWVTSVKDDTYGAFIATNKTRHIERRPILRGKRYMIMVRSWFWTYSI